MFPYRPCLPGLVSDLCETRAFVLYRPEKENLNIIENETLHFFEMMAFVYFGCTWALYGLCVYTIVLSCTATVYESVPFKSVHFYRGFPQKHSGEL